MKNCPQSAIKKIYGTEQSVLLISTNQHGVFRQFNFLKFVEVYMRYLVIASLVLLCGCARKPAEEQVFTDEQFEIESLTAEEAADFLKRFKTDSLWLPGLRSLDKEVAHELAKFNGSVISLFGNCLPSSVDREVAHELAKFKGDQLTVPVLKDRYVARELAKFSGQQLNLCRLMWIDKDIAQELAHFKGDILGLSELTSIDEETLAELEKFKGGTISLTGLVSVDKNVLHKLESNPAIYFLPENFRH